MAVPVPGYDGFSAPAALSRDPRVQLLGLLRRFGTLTRADLAEYLGVSTTMVGEWIAELARAGLIEEAGKGESRGGRPPRRVVLAGEAAHAVGIDCSGWPVRAVVRDLVGRVCFEVALAAGDAIWARPGRPDPRAAEGDGAPPTSIADIVTVAELVVERSEVARARVGAVGVALAGFVDTRRGTHRPVAL